LTGVFLRSTFFRPPQLIREDVKSTIIDILIKFVI